MALRDFSGKETIEELEVDTGGAFRQKLIWMICPNYKNLDDSLRGVLYDLQGRRLNNKPSKVCIYKTARRKILV